MGFLRKLNVLLFLCLAFLFWNDSYSEDLNRYSLLSESIDFSSLTPSFPDEVDLREWDINNQNVPPHRQPNLGGCYIYAAIHYLESYHHYKTGELVRFDPTFLFVKEMERRATESRFGEESTPTSGGPNEVYSKEISDFGLVPYGVWEPKENIITEKDKLFVGELVREQGNIDEVKDTIELCAGKYPEKFEINGKQLTPKDYGKMFLEMYPELLELSGVTAPGVAHLDWSKLKPFEIGEILVEQLEKGKTVLISFYSNKRKFGDVDRGIFSLSAYGLSWLQPPFNHRKDQRKKGFTKKSHVAEVVGVKFDSNGAIQRLRLRNTWGTNRGDGGYYSMDAHYFYAFVKAIQYAE